MDLEYVGIRLITIGLKKYAFIKENGDYAWRTSGIRARQNIHVDVVAMFEKVLVGGGEHVDHCAITAGADFELRHSVPGEHKKLRFIRRKGAMEADTIRWWNDDEEFADHVDRIHPTDFRPGKV